LFENVNNALHGMQQNGLFHTCSTSGHTTVKMLKLNSLLTLRNKF